MTAHQDALVRAGDLVLYDRFGTSYDVMSPSTAEEDYGMGIVLQILTDGSNKIEDFYAHVMKDDGTTGFFSLSYLLKARS